MIETIEQYVEHCFEMRKESGSDLINTFEADLKYNIKLIHAEVKRRIRFGIPIHFINAYNIDSCIVPLRTRNDYYHIIDISMFGYFQELLTALEFDLPNYAVFIYRKMRYDICLSKCDKGEALRYNPKVIYANSHDLENNTLSRNYSETQIEKYKCMVRFYFLHEYAHYLIANPIRKATNDFADIVVEIFFENLERNRSQDSSSELSKRIQRDMIEHYRHEWNNNLGFKEEIYCDFQAIICLLELPGINNKISVEMILDSVMSFMYLQHIIWLAKHIEEPIEVGNIFSFRQNIIGTFAWLMEEDFANRVSELLQHSNKFFVPTNLQVSPMRWEKQHDFYKWFIEIIMADRKKEIKNEQYVFPFFIQPKYEFSSDYLKQKNIPDWFVDIAPY